MMISFISLTVILLSIVCNSAAFLLPPLSPIISRQSSSSNNCPNSSSSSSDTFFNTKNLLHASKDPDKNENETPSTNSVANRFLSPRIDDAGLPVADTLLAQIVAPSLQVFWLSANHAPLPTWLAPLFASSKSSLYNLPTQGALVAPTLIHGAGLACCWLMGALASKSFESDAFNISGGRGYGTVVSRIVQAGSFATGLLILSTQVDLLLEYGRYVQPGESEEIDVRLLSAIVELINDIVFEAAVLGSWRLYRASLTGDPSGRPPNYKP